MAEIRSSILELVGRTPMVRLNRMPAKDSAEVLVKLESFNPGGSIKDRISLAMIEAAERSGALVEGGTVVEPTSGSTGIGLAMVCAVKGYDLIITMPDDASKQRQAILKHFGATVVLTPARKLMRGAIDEAQRIAAQSPRCFMPQQFDNLSNPEIHRRTTALEILADTDEKLDAFVAGVGTGGTISGVGAVLKEKTPNVQIIAVEPLKSRVLAGEKAEPHAIQGIGAGFVPAVMNTELVDKFAACSDADAFSTAAMLAQKEGISAGLSGGAAVSVALDVARELGRGKRVVVMIPDNWERYTDVTQPEPAIGGLDFII